MIRDQKRDSVEDLLLHFRFQKKKNFINANNLFFAKNLVNQCYLKNETRNQLKVSSLNPEPNTMKVERRK